MTNLLLEFTDTSIDDAKNGKHVLCHALRYMWTPTDTNSTCTLPEYTFRASPGDAGNLDLVFITTPHHVRSDMYASYASRAHMTHMLRVHGFFAVSTQDAKIVAAYRSDDNAAFVAITIIILFFLVLVIARRRKAQLARNEHQYADVNLDAINEDT